MTQRDWKKDMEMCEAATPGPWSSILEDLEEREYYPAAYLPTEIKSVEEVVVDFDGINLETKHCIPNAQLMAESRTALPYWLQEAKERGEREQRLKEMVENEIMYLETAGLTRAKLLRRKLNSIYPDTPAPKEEDNQ
ncbi:hypothetical protein [Paenibacillus sp. B2(2019)]|uniref:hypothetical protein n=1 Tax=Paenibacillus sp. B2(2019) TaxID=2607754 RepID=UPI0011F37749|nr:hypothetical protein [Paenibacillus sp. B2(2019)]KAA1180675.1 hypothetical protein PAENI_25835 [Paenibacillus sp. B2(2019)]